MSDHRTPLDAEIRERIARQGPMPVADFMALCLYDLAHGYYNRRDVIGAAGDFVTAPEISQMFGELIGLWAAMAWQAIGAPTPVQLIELGPGRGTLMADALRAMRTAPEFRKAARVHLVETSSEMQLRQRETLGDVEDMTLRWHAALDEVPQGPAIIIANEFFDALPVRQVERCPSGWHERAVAVNAGGELALTVMPEPLDGIEAALPAAVESCARRRYLRMARRRVRRAGRPARGRGRRGAHHRLWSCEKRRRRHVPGRAPASLRKPVGASRVDGPYRARGFRGAGARGGGRGCARTRTVATGDVA